MNHDAFELGLDDINNAGVYAIGNDDIGPLSAAMRNAGLRVATIDLAGCHDKRTLAVVDGIRLRACLLGKVGLDRAAFVINAVQLCGFRLSSLEIVRHQKLES